ncbi:MAG TPA: galactokinase [Acidimicrobiales bacterium]|nr:galactokinase [Acidimicrobiales bacterium]
MRSAFAPGRVNLIGDHTDYTGGYVLPMAIDLGITVSVDPGGDRVVLKSSIEADVVDLPIRLSDPRSVNDGWGRYVAGVIAEIRPVTGATGTVSSTLPSGVGLASSAALEVAVALALGYAGPPADLAVACQRAEQRSAGVPCGVMDQLASATGVAGHALLIDCSSNEVKPIAFPDGCEIVAIPSGEQRKLARSAYAERRYACEQAEYYLGPLRSAALVDVAKLNDPILRSRVRHVVTENSRVLEFAQLFRYGKLVEAGRLMYESHRSLRDDFNVSTPALDSIVERLMATPGVYGARLTGAGFGGCVVALTRPGVLSEGWRLEPSDGARIL